MRTLVLTLAAAGVCAAGVAARGDTLVHFTFMIATGPGAGGIGVTNTNFDVYADIYANPAITSNNFLTYVNNSAYSDTFIHRSIPGFVLQGGGFTVVGPQTYGNVPTLAPIPLEYTVPNVKGTLAMARTSDPNSATSQFFINIADNTTVLGNGPGGSSPGLGYAVFGNVLSGSLANVDTLAAVPNYNVDNGLFANLPLTQPQIDLVYYSVHLNSVTSVARMGDLNLDNHVNIDDVLLFDQAYLNPPPGSGWGANNFAVGWGKGDLNLDGVVNTADWTLMRTAYLQTGGGLSTDDQLTLSPTPIPEPGTLGALGCGALLLMRRRRPY